MTAIKQTISALTCVVTLLLGTAHGVKVSYSIIAQSGMLRPDGMTTYQELDLAMQPINHKGDIYFGDREELYKYSNGSITHVLTNYTAYPALGTGPLYVNFSGMSPIGEDAFMFTGLDATGKEVLLKYENGSLDWLLPPSVTFDVPTNLPWSILGASVSGDRMAVNINTVTREVDPLDPAVTNLIYSNAWFLVQGGTSARILEPGTVLSNGLTVSRIFNVTLGKSNLVAYGRFSSGTEGLVLLSDSSCETIALLGDHLPGSPRITQAFGTVIMDDQDVVFVSATEKLESDLYRYRAGQYQRIVGTGSPLGDGGGVVERVESVGYDGGNCLLNGNYLSFGGTFHQLVKPTDNTGCGEIVTLQGNGLGLSGNSVVSKVFNSQGTFFILKADLAFDEMDSVSADYDGDGSDDTALYDKSSDTWFIRAKNKDFESHQFGYGDTLPAPGDYDDDGIADFAVYDPPSGNWYILASHDGFRIVQFGYYGTVPTARDYDGDGRCDIGIFDPASGWWYIYGSTDGFRMEQFGYYGTSPIPADFDNDGKVDIAVYENARGLWYIHRSGANDLMVQQFGYAGATPVPVDFDGGGADFAVFDPNGGLWFSHGQVDGFQMRQFGYNGVLPVSADYDGDAKSDLGVYDPYRALWYLLRTSAGFKTGGL